jgi:glycosyltransferase involved in cell wall biosynthesis
MRVSRRIGLYCPELPPVRGGLADHTLVLARALAARGADVVVIGRRGDASLFAPIPCRTGVSHRPGPGGLAAACRSLGVRSLLVQYVPFLFARRGLAPALVASVARLARNGIRIGLLVHEPWVPPTRAVWRVTGPLMRRQLLALVARADAVLTPVPAFLERVRPAVRAGVPCEVAPVGATVPVVDADRGAVRASLGLVDGDVVLGVFSPGAAGARGAWVVAAAAALAGDRRIAWVLFGGGSRTEPADLPAGVRVQRLGWLPPERVSQVLQALDLALAPYEDGLTLRRSSAMAALAHGVPLLSSRGLLFDPTLDAAAECPAAADGFVARALALVADPAARAALGVRGRMFHRERGSVEVLAGRVVATLGEAA